MALPGNGIFVVRGEMSTVMTAMRRGARWSSHSHHQDDDDALIRGFQELKELLNTMDDLRLVQPIKFLTPFLDVIRSEDTTGPITSLALCAVNKFLSYGLIDPTHASVPTTVHKIADAVTHARFVGTDQTSDGVVLMRILQVLRTLTLAPEGATLTNESLCEIMLSCFRICFETRLNELLRRTAEHYLKDMVQLVFMRLPQFSEDMRVFRQFRMRPGAIEQTRTRRRRSVRMRKEEDADKAERAESPTNSNSLIPPGSEHQGHLSTTPQTPAGNIVDMHGQLSQSTPSDCGNRDLATASPSSIVSTDGIEIEVQESTVAPSEPQPADQAPSEEATEGAEVPEVTSGACNGATTPPPPLPPPLSIREEAVDENQEEYVNQRGIRFTPQIQEEAVPVPYGLACVRELVRFLISLCNPLDKQNNDVMIHLGLTLLTVAFEVGADSIGRYTVLLTLVKDDLCRNLFSLLTSERLSVFSACLQVCFLMFESLRTHLKFQLEFYLSRLIEIVVTDSGKVTYEHKEIALDNILQLWRIPGFVTELYLNYDCNMYCSNLYEDLTKLLAKNAFSATSGVYHTHMLSLDALLTVIGGIEKHCCDNSLKGSNENDQHGNDCSSDTTVENIDRIIENGGSRQKFSEDVPSKAELMAKKAIKKWLPTGTEHFNLKPKKGIQFLQEHGVLSPDADAIEIATFLRENSALDKKMIGEYVSNRSNLRILDAFVKTFNFTNIRIDEALRYFLEAFRLPGEAAVITMILEQFAEHWHKSNGEPFANVDAAFTLAYAIIMLNVAQHNENAKKQNTPMSLDGFRNNLRDANDGGPFDQDMLEEVYNAIKNEEIVMPAEQTGLVRENYLWKVLLRKGMSRDGRFVHVPNGQFDHEIFQLIWSPIVAALSFVFDKSEEAAVYKKALDGFSKCAAISYHFGMTKNLDMLLLTVCKFTTFHGAGSSGNGHSQRTNNSIIVNFGASAKARLSLRLATDLCHRYGDAIREGWRNLFDVILSLYTHHLLPKLYVEAEDFIQPRGKIVLTYEEAENVQKQDAGLFSSLYSYMVSNENLSSKIPSAEEQQCIDLAKQTIADCNFEQIVTDSKFLHDDALAELVKALIELSRGPDVQRSLGYGYNENVAVFFLELLVKIAMQNRDRIMTIWQLVRDHIYSLMMNASVFDYQFLLERSVIGLLRMAIRLMRNEDMSPVVLQSMRMLLLLKSTTLSRISLQISYGLYELLTTSAQNIHTKTDWTIIFTLLECVGAGAQPPKPVADDGSTKSDGEQGHAHSDEEISSDRGYTSDSELTKSPKHGGARSHTPPPVTTPLGSPNTGGWILVGSEGEIQPVMGRTVPPSQYNLALEKNVATGAALDPDSMTKCCESLTFLVRDVAHITPYNFDDCVHCIRTFVEATLCDNMRSKRTGGHSESRTRTRKGTRSRRAEVTRKSPASTPTELDTEEYFPSGHDAIQLLDLMHTLHTRTAQIFKWWAEEGGGVVDTQNISLWTQGWCPLLQGIARLCCDVREDVRMEAINYLQRALLVHDLQTLNGPEWEACFHRVLFPLLGYLLNPVDPRPNLMEETRSRAATVLSKVFLHHLTPLLSLPTFSNLWLIILDLTDKYMHADNSDLLLEAIPESLKNMLLVMNSAGVFDGPDGNKNPLWATTWDRVDKFLPKHLRDDLFKEISATKGIHDDSATAQAPSAPPSPTERAQTPQQRDFTENPVPPQLPPKATSIILQPPLPQQPPQQVSSHLFAHLGQMVSTPISATSMQPTLQPGMPYLYPQADMPHTFPVLYNSVPTSTPTIPAVTPIISAAAPIIPATTPTQVQPTSMYGDRPPIPIPNRVTEDNNVAKDYHPDDVINRNENRLNLANRASPNNNSSPSNFFQSSNYFIDSGVPPGSEILFGSNQEGGDVTIPTTAHPADSEMIKIATDV